MLNKWTCNKKRARFFKVLNTVLICMATRMPWMSTFMNFFDRIAAKQSFLMVRRLAEMSLFLENRGEKRKTRKPASVTVTVTVERSRSGL